MDNPTLASPIFRRTSRGDNGMGHGVFGNDGSRSTQFGTTENSEVGGEDYLGAEGRTNEVRARYATRREAAMSQVAPANTHTGASRLHECT